VGFSSSLSAPLLITGFRLLALNQTSFRLSQGCGSGSGSLLDQDSIRSVDPDPYSESGSGYRRAKMNHKSRKKFRNFMF
jgi:hypothetical protein